MSELTGNVIPKSLITIGEKAFEIEQVIVAKIIKDNIMLGDFTLFMPVGVQLKHIHFVEIYTRQVGLYLTRKKAEDFRRGAEETLANQLKLEKTISDISSFFVSLSFGQLDLGINHALELSGEFLETDRSYVFRFSADGKTMNNTHGCSKGIVPQINKIQNFPIVELPWWLEQVRNNDYVYIYDIDTLPPEAYAEQKEFQSQDICSLLGIPITKDSNLIGFLGFDGVKKKLVLEEGNLTLLKILGELISNAIARHMADEEIRYLSFHDSLTGLYNRAFLKEEMERLDTSRQIPIAVIIADLNGLKLINDTYGHAVGDNMLRLAADILERSCRKEDIIARWGGDEFIIYLPKTAEKEADQICKRIMTKCRETFVEDLPISMSIGIGIKIEREKDLSEVVKLAEDNMYKHKLIESKGAKNQVLLALLKTLKEKAYETEQHISGMQSIAYKIGIKMGLPETELNRLSLLISLHDIGKINISEEVLTKADGLTKEEWEIIKKHPEIGYRITRSTEEFAHIAEDILCHHENWDGSGYPRCLKNKETPLLARITAIADAYEVMINTSM